MPNSEAKGLNVGFPSRPTRFCGVFWRCSPSTKCKHNYGDDDNNNNKNNNNKFNVVFDVIILIIVIIDLSINVVRSTSYISEE